MSYGMNKSNKVETLQSCAMTILVRETIAGPSKEYIECIAFDFDKLCFSVYYATTVLSSQTSHRTATNETLLFSYRITSYDRWNNIPQRSLL